jgi:hypothetical protein
MMGGQIPDWQAPIPASADGVVRRRIKRLRRDLHRRFIELVHQHGDPTGEEMRQIVRDGRQTEVLFRTGAEMSLVASVLADRACDFIKGRSVGEAIGSPAAQSTEDTDAILG